MTPDDLIDYGYCQSSPRAADIQRLAKIKASSVRLRLRGRDADSSLSDAWNFIHSHGLHLSLECFFFFCASFQGRLKSSTARCCFFFLVKLKESEISWKHSDKELSIKRNRKKKTLFSWRRYRIITPQFFFSLSLLLSTGVLDVASDRIWSPMHHERKKGRSLTCAP